MTKRTLPAVCIALIFCLPAPAAFAAGAFFVDDADIVDPDTVQTENWFSHSSRDESIGVDDIAYQLLPGAEFTLLNAVDKMPGVDASDTLTGQVKYKWRDGDEGKDIMSSAVFGIGYGTDNRFAGAYAYIPSTWKLDEMFDINADLGWQYFADDGRNMVTWGLGGDLHASDALTFSAEVFRQTIGRAGMQAGPRITLSKDVEMDLVYGRDITGTAANWMTAGLTVTF
jgi:hypothetical protein